MSNSRLSALKHSLAFLLSQKIDLRPQIPDGPVAIRDSRDFVALDVGPNRRLQNVESGQLRLQLLEALVVLLHTCCGEQAARHPGVSAPRRVGRLVVAFGAVIDWPRLDSCGWLICTFEIEC